MVSYPGVHLDDKEYDYCRNFLTDFWNNRQLGKGGLVSPYMSGEAYRVAMEILEMQRAYCEQNNPDDAERRPDFKNLPTITNLWDRLTGEFMPHDRKFRVRKVGLMGPYVTKDFKENDPEKLDPLLWTLGIRQMSKEDVLSGLHELGDFGMTEKEYGLTSPGRAGSITLLDLVR